jgi:nucleoid DNA-binding protein
MATSLRRTLVRHIFAQQVKFMHHLIASYLFQNKRCPLPGLGTLSVLNSGAEADFTNKLIAAPKAFIQFTNTETDTHGLLNYLSAATGADKYEATEALSHFCDDIKQKIADEQKVELDSIGNFFVDSSGKIHFKQEELSAAFTQPVFAERVIHPDAEHQILVGDKESTNTEMTEYLAPKEVIKSRWWIWAIVLGAIGLLALLIYFSEFYGAYPFGNVIKN